MKKERIICKNCEETFKEGFDFCPHCGQKVNEELTMGVLFYNTISNYFTFDARFFKSFLPLLFKPGYLAKTFIKGKRLLYLHPAQLYLFVTVVFFFLYSFKIREASQGLDNAFKEGGEIEKVIETNEVKNVLDSLSIKDKLNGLEDRILYSSDTIIGNSKTIDSILEKKRNHVKNLSFDFNRAKVDSLIAVNNSDEDIYKAMGLEENAGFIKRKLYKQALKFYKNKRPGGILQSFYDSVPISLFILLPIFALLLKLFYYKKGPFAHHLVFSFYYFSFLFTVFSLILLVNRIWDIPDVIDGLLVVSTFLYLVLAIKHFYKQGYFLSLFKTGLITFLYLLLVIPIAIIVLSIVAFMFY